MLKFQQFGFLFLLVLLLPSCLVFDSQYPVKGRPSVDWEGSYYGTLPCADCPGIETTIRLMRDKSFEKTTHYLEKGEELFEESGTFLWNKKGTTISLISASQPDERNYFQVMENNIVLLDQKGRKIATNHPELYTLEKLPAIMETYWMLSEINGSEVIPPEDWKRGAHFILKNKDQRTYGNTSCNAFTGKFTVSGNYSIRFENIMATKKACIDNIYEKDYIKVLSMATSYSIDKKTLSLFNSRENLLAKFIAK